MADSDDWRVTISVSGQSPAGQAQQSFSLRQVEEEVRGQVGRSVAVGAGDAQIFLYAGAETAARDAERIALGVLSQHGAAAESALHRWHPIEEQWEAVHALLTSRCSECAHRRHRHGAPGPTTRPATNKFPIAG